MVFELVIGANDAGTSPKSFLNKNLDEPYHKIFKLIKDKRITINGKKIKDDSRLSEGDVIKIWLDSVRVKEQKERVKILGRDLGMQTIFENEDFLVLNKLPEVVVQGAQDNDTSLSIHLQFLKDKNKDNSDFQYFHVHRLDKDTSGVLICAKNQIALRDLNKAFMSRDVVKKYVCLCVGKFKEKSGRVEVNLDRTPQGSKEKVFVALEGGKKSISIYNVLKEYNFEGQVFSFVEVEIQTGITHQIRVHMKYLGCPIVGDSMYGNSYINKMFEEVLDRQFLHAKSLDLKFNGDEYKFEAELIEDLKCALDFIS